MKQPLYGFYIRIIQALCFFPQLDEQSWITVLENITEEGAGTVVDVQITSLQSNTDYVIRVTASNLLGATMTETQVKTMSECSLEFFFFFLFDRIQKKKKKQRKCSARHINRWGCQT